jgi:hypothetical protein
MSPAKPRQIRVTDELWDAFDEATEAMGTDRAKALNAFMRRYVSAVSVTQSDSVDQERDPSRSGA